MREKTFLKGMTLFLTAAGLSFSPLFTADALTIHGNLLFSSAESPRAPGIYTFDTTAASSLQAVAGGENVLSHGGGVYVDGKYYSINADQKSLTVYDAETWRVDKTFADVTPALSLAYDESQNKIYGCFVDGNPVLGLLDSATGKYSAIGVMNVQPVAIMITPSSELFAIGVDGGVYRVDKNNASMTVIGSTGVTPFSVQDAVVDPDSGKCYWTAVRDDYTSGLYEVDLTAGSATLIYNFPGDEAITGLYIVPEVSPLAPAKVTGLQADFSGPSTSGAVKFTMPGVTAGGDALSGNLTWQLQAADVIKSGSAAPGAEVNVPLTLPEGMVDIRVTVSNAAGEGAKAVISRWIGVDKPMPVSDLRLEKTAPNGLSLSWDMPAAGVNGGYIDTSALKCTVVRYPGNVTVASASANTVFAETVEAPRLAPYWYVVTVEADGVASDAVSSNRITMGAPKEIPYEEDFSSTIQFNNIMVTDANADGMTWGHNIAAERASYPGQLNVNADDWMVTPPLALDAADNYRMQFDVCANSFDPHMLEVRLGALPNVKDLTVELLPGTVVDTPYDWRTLSVNFHVDKTGEYYLGFHAISAPNSGSLDFDNLKVERIGSSLAPAAPANLMAEPYENGALGAKITLMAPDKLVNGQSLNGTFTLSLSRNGTVIKTFENVTSGQTLSFDDSAAVQGFNTYSAVASNGNGAGESCDIKVYVGVDIPGLVTGLKVVETSPGHVSITWNAPVSGKNGGYVDPSQLTYNVKRNEWKEVAAEGCSALDFIEESLSEQMFMVYHVEAVSPVGTGDKAASDLIVVGTPYDAPVNESFAGGRSVYYPWASTPLSSVNSWNAWSMADELINDYEGDGGAMSVVCFTPNPEEITLQSPKLNIGATVNPQMKFMLAHTAIDDYLDVELIADGENLGVVKRVPLHDEALTWTEVTVPLDRCADRSTVQLALHTRNVCGDDKLYVDAFSFIDEVDDNLAAGMIETPVKLFAGREATVKALVNNVGRKSASGYSVNLYAAGNLVATGKGVAVEPGSSAGVSLSFVPSAVSGSELKLHSEVVYDADQSLANNVSVEFTVPLEVVDKPVVASLHSSKSGSDVVLEWEAPELPADEWEVTTEDFESLPAFSLTDFGPWLSVEGDPGALYCMEFQNSQGDWVTFPGDYGWENYAFSTIDLTQLPNAKSSDGWNCVSGSKFMMTAYSTGMNGIASQGDYLVSPLLKGCAQQMVFNAKSLNYMGDGLETVRVLASSTDTDLSSFTEVQRFKNVPATWTRYTVELPEGTRYFAIHSVSTATALFLDDISYIADGAALITNEILGYNVYRNGLLVNNGPQSNLSFTDTAADPSGAYEYAVSVVYAEGESACVRLRVDVAGIDGITANDNMSISVSQGMIHVDNCGLSNISVYSTDGRLVNRHTDVDHADIPVSPGIYIVTAGDRTAKVVVR